MRGIYYLFIVLSTMACDQLDVAKNAVNEDKQMEISGLFKLRVASTTGIHFINPIEENVVMNGLVYEYLYNGAGVAVCDFNGDDLPDIYFISNLQSNKLYLNRGGLQFEDVTLVSDLKGKHGFATGVTTVDINHDGLMDIYVCKSGVFTDPEKRRNELYINKGNSPTGIPLFKENAAEYQLDLAHQSTQASFFDYDKDGDLDMFLINHGTNPGKVMVGQKVKKGIKERWTNDCLFRNDNDKFYDVSEESGIIGSSNSYGLGLAIGDLNNDGWPDVLVGHDYYERDHLYLNNSDGTFKEVIKKTTNHISNFSMGNDIADFNNDGWLDFMSLDMVSDNNYDTKTSMSGMDRFRFYQTVDSGQHFQYMYNTLQLNNGVTNDGLPHFSDIGQLSGTSSTDWSWSALFFDMNNDGFKDLFVSNGIKRDFRNNDFVEYRNKKTLQYLTNIKRNLHNETTITKAHVIDLLRSMPRRKKTNRLYQNHDGYYFKDKTTSWGIEYPTSSNGAAYADLDRDGDLDIVTNNIDEYAFVYENQLDKTNHGHFLQIRLNGDEKNKFGIGARVEVVNNNGLKQIQEQYLTRGFQSSGDNILHFGLPNSSPCTVKVTWADGKEQGLYDIKPDQIVELEQREAQEPNSRQINADKLFMAADNLLPFTHYENEFDDFERESLIPHSMSRFGPAMAIADINGDGYQNIYLGGAIGQSGAIYSKTTNGLYAPIQELYALKDKEEVDALFFDADNDSDLDLLIAIGGNEHLEGHSALKDELYINDGKGKFIRAVDALPDIGFSAGVVRSLDFDNDGDQDLLITGRQVPGKYGYPATTRLYENRLEGRKIKFQDVTMARAGAFKGIGMISSALCEDLNGDGWTDILLAGEWTNPMVFMNDFGKFRKHQQPELDTLYGWWFSLASADFDQDGDLDIIGGNLGENYKYQATLAEPFELHTSDFDGNGKLDIVLSYNQAGKNYPLRGRECSSNQMPFIKERFKTYDAFAQAGLDNVYGAGKLEKALHLKAYTFSSFYFQNDGKGNFNPIPLPAQAQFSSINTIVSYDFDSDDNLDVVIAGNLYGSEVETPRADASYALFLKGDGAGKFKPIPAFQSGLFVQGDVRQAGLISDHGRGRIVFARNNEPVLTVIINDTKPSEVLTQLGK